jgi:hypothetical protein
MGIDMKINPDFWFSYGRMISAMFCDFVIIQGVAIWGFIAIRGEIL